MIPTLRTLLLLAFVLVGSYPVLEGGSRPALAQESEAAPPLTNPPAANPGADGSFPPSSSQAAATAAAAPPGGIGGLPLVDRASTLKFYFVGILIFGGICIFFQAVFFWRQSAGPELVVRSLIVTLVITLGLVLFTVDPDQTHYGPVMALYGSVVGFLLGRTPQNGKQND